MRSNEINHVIRSLNSENPTDRASAALKAGENSLKATVPILVHLLSDPNPEVRMRAVGSIGVMTASSTIASKIAKMLTDSDELVRAEAISALQIMKAKNALPRLVKCLNDKSPIVRSFAASSIGALGQKRLHLKTLLQGYNRENDSNARVGYLAGLYQLGRRDCFVVLVAFLKSANYKNMFAAANMLLEIMNKRDREILASILPFLVQDEEDKFRKEKLLDVLSEISC